MLRSLRARRHDGPSPSRLNRAFVPARLVATTVSSSGYVSEPGNAMDSQTVEIIGRNYLVSRLVADGLEVARPERDRGVDLIAYLDLGEAGRFVACPIQMKAATKASFSVHHKYERIAQLILAYVWNTQVPNQARAYALTYVEAKQVAEEMGWTNTISWQRGGYSTTRPSRSLQALLEPFLMREGDWRRKVEEAGAGITP